MIDQTNIAESRQQSRTIGLMTFLNQITLFLIGLSFSLQIERGQIVSWFGVLGIIIMPQVLNLLGFS